MSRTQEKEIAELRRNVLVLQNIAASILVGFDRLENGGQTSPRKKIATETVAELKARVISGAAKPKQLIKTKKPRR